MATYHSKITDLDKKLSIEFSEKRFLDLLKNLAMCFSKHNYALYINMQAAFTKILHAIFKYIETEAPINNKIENFQKRAFKDNTGSGSFCYGINILSEFNLPQELKIALLDINSKANAIKHDDQVRFLITDVEVESAYNTYKTFLSYLGRLTDTDCFSKLAKITERFITENEETNFNNKIEASRKYLNKLQKEYEDSGALKRIQIKKDIKNEKEVLISLLKAKAAENKKKINIDFENDKKSIKNNKNINIFKRYILLKHRANKTKQALKNFENKTKNEIRKIKSKY